MSIWPTRPWLEEKAAVSGRNSEALQHVEETTAGRAGLGVIRNQGATAGIAHALELVTLYDTLTTNRGTGIRFMIGTTEDTSYAVARIYGDYIAADGSGRLIFQTNGGGAGGTDWEPALLATRMVIDENGYVGVGSLDPLAPLDMETALGNTLGKFGATLPVYLLQNYPSVGFNLYTNSGAKFGKGSAGSYAGVLEFDPTSANLTYYGSTAGGNADAAVSLQALLVVTGVGTVKAGIGAGAHGAMTVAHATWPTLALERYDTSILSGDSIGTIDFYSDDASTSLAGVVARIDAVAATDFSSASSPAGANCDLIFKTNTGNAGTLGEVLRLRYDGDIQLAEGADLIVGTVTGTKIGLVGGAAGQKLAFWGATPIVQPVLATGGGATVDNVITALQNLGLVRQS